MRLKVVNRSGLTYSTRRMQAGDIFEPKSKRDARILLATRKVERLRDPVDVPAPPPELMAKIAQPIAPTPYTSADVVSVATTDERPSLRAEYEQVLGKAPWVGWNADQLREKIAAAQEVS